MHDNFLVADKRAHRFEGEAFGGGFGLGRQDHVALFDQACCAQGEQIRAAGADADGVEVAGLWFCCDALCHVFFLMLRSLYV
jgi:hypothetical protein